MASYLLFKKKKVEGAVSECFKNPGLSHYIVFLSNYGVEGEFRHSLLFD